MVVFLVTGGNRLTDTSPNQTIKAALHMQVKDHGETWYHEKGKERVNLSFLLVLFIFIIQLI
ncbi:hypothetical protein [Ectobacillus sp. sgz5001026]|uniref:hypothetical protein n=1 Tax=Ectobacillus sp. sgz5001026 TaxID=3242473 RepID=UPI0036D34FAD